MRKKQREEEQKCKTRKAVKREAAFKAKKAEKKQKKSLQKALKRKPTSSMAPRPKQNKARSDMDETIHTDLCCVRFGSYDEDIWMRVAGVR